MNEELLPVHKQREWFSETEFIPSVDAMKIIDYYKPYKAGQV